MESGGAGKNKIPWYWSASDGQLFDGVDSKVQKAFLEKVQLKTFRKHQKLFDAMDIANYVYFLRKGLVKIYNRSPSGSVTLFWFCGPGTIFGAGGISGSRLQAVSAQAVRDSSVFILPHAAFEELIESNPRIGLNVIRILSARLRLACDAFAHRTEVHATARISRLLLQLAHAPPPDWRNGHASVAITQQDLADMAGAGRQTVNGALKELREAGIIETERGHLTILSVEALEGYYNSLAE